MPNFNAPLSQAVADLGLGDMNLEQLDAEAEKRKKLMQSKDQQNAAYGASLMSPAAQALFANTKMPSN